MIDKRVFAEGMALLGGAFGREVDGPVSRIYFEILSPEFDDAQWMTAVRQVIATEHFWPPVSALRDAVLGNPKQLADKALTALLEQVEEYYLPNTGTQLRLSPDAAACLTGPVRAALRAVGGVGRLNVGAENWPATAQRFREAYAQSLTETRTALPSGDRLALSPPTPQNV